MKSTVAEKKIISIIKRIGVLRSRDLASYSIPRKYLSRLCEKGILSRSGRGIYVPGSAANFTEHHTLAEVCKRVPKGVVCLLSALQFHNLTTQMPAEVWLAIDRKSRLPKEPNLPMRIVRFSGKALKEGIAEHLIEGVKVRIYCPAKSVVDCFKYRNKIGLDIAIEALRECRRQRRCSNDELWQFANICRVAKVMRPYLEATL